MLAPQTPKKAGDEIDRIEQSLAAKWGLRFPVRDSAWRPSRRDPNSLEDKIHGRIKYLYYIKGPAEGALNYAVARFELHASSIASKWQFKPRGEPDVIPSRGYDESTSNGGFLVKRQNLSEAARNELMECLHATLSQVAEKAIAGQPYMLATKLANSVEASREPMDRETMTSRLSTATHQPLPQRKQTRQIPLTNYFRSHSEPTITTKRPRTVIQSPSSDDYPDEEFTGIIEDIDMPDAPTKVEAPGSLYPRAGNPSGHSSSDENFETLPTSPLHRKNQRPALDTLNANASNTDSYAGLFRKPDLRTSPSRKKPCRAADVPLLTREASRDDSSTPLSAESRNASSIGRFAPLTGNRKLNFIPPAPPVDDVSNPSISLDSSHSADNIASMTSSISTSSSGWTSLHTSLCTNSLATSFSSTGEESGSTMYPAMTRTEIRPADQAAQPIIIEQLQEFRDNGQGATSAIKKTRQGAKDVENDTGRRDGILEGKVDLARPTKAMGLFDPEHFAHRLLSHTPFASPDLSNGAKVPFRQIYEVLRVSLSCNIEFSKISTFLEKSIDDYDRLWSLLASIVKAHGTQLPERSSLVAWEKAGHGFDGVALSAKLSYTELSVGPVFQLILNPMRMEASYRLSRKFGSDRFLVVAIPGLSPESLPGYLKPSHAAVRNAIVSWLTSTEHRLLGRVWRAFYAKAEMPKKSQKGNRTSMNEFRFRIYLFAENGNNFRQGARHGEIDSRVPDRPHITIAELVDWFMPSKNNSSQPCLKFFSRLTLGLSSTTPTVEFRPSEIFRSDDARADCPGQRRLNYRRSEELKTQRNPSNSKAPVMNDGCSRISRAAAFAVAEMLGLDHVPCVFQGRIGGAKGIWMVDCLDETPSKDGRNFWIEITDSQLKFNGHNLDALNPDPARVTFEVNKFSKRLSSSVLNFPLIPILAAGGVPDCVFVRLLEEDLSLRVGDMEVAMDTGLSLRQWNQENNSVTDERSRYGGIEMTGGLPDSNAEKINWFVEHGFEPKECHFLKEQLYKAILAYCLRLESRMNIGIGQSTVAFMIADPLAILEENEVHLGFSNTFRDPTSSFDQTMLHDLDILVARSPAHLPSDIQKVHAVFKPDLRTFRDVIVFSSKGQVPLASKLSGGDYDGDKAWICWDPLPPSPNIETYGIVKDNTKVFDLLHHDDYMNRFLKHALDFNLQMSMLGTCSIYHEAYCYAKKGIDTPQAVSIAMLLGNLVDSAKGGYQFDGPKWDAFLKKQRLPKKLARPAYKDRDKARPTSQLIDRLVFEVAPKARHEALGNFARQFANVSWKDDDLVRVRNEVIEEVKNDETVALALMSLQSELDAIHTFWRTNMRRDEDEDLRPDRKPTALSFRTVVEKCRADFLAIKPTNPGSASGDVSNTVKRWQRDHSSGKPSHWDLVKASVAFNHHLKTKFVWYIAGVELSQMKATARGRGTYRITAGRVFESFKLDSKLVDGIKRRKMGAADPQGAGEDNDDDEYGEWGWEDEFRFA